MADENLNQAAAQNYYWQSDNENTVVENVGIVLDSLSDIVANNSLNENQFVAWTPSEEEEKGKFELKTILPPSPKTIEANENIILVGDGEEWTRGNAANISIENEEDNVYLNINKDLDSFCIQGVNGDEKTSIFNAVKGNYVNLSGSNNSIDFLKNNSYILMNSNGGSIVFGGPSSGSVQTSYQQILMLGHDSEIRLGGTEKGTTNNTQSINLQGNSQIEMGIVATMINSPKFQMGGNSNLSVGSSAFESDEIPKQTSTTRVSFQGHSYTSVSDNAYIRIVGSRDSAIYDDKNTYPTGDLGSEIYIRTNNKSQGFYTPLDKKREEFIRIHNNNILIGSKGLYIEYAIMIENNTAQPCIKLSYEDDNNNTKEVQFSLDDLIDLKRFIGTTPSNVVNNIQEMTTPDRLYFIPAEVVPVNEQGGE